MTDPEPVGAHSARRVALTDNTIGSFLAARRKAVTGLLAFAAVLAAGGIVPHNVALAVQGIIAFLGVYGIHEVANDPQPAAEALRAPAARAASMGPDAP